MELSKIKSKIEKLKRMAETSGPEAENAKRLIQNLIQKYEVNPEELDAPKEWITYRLHRLKKYGIHLARWMRIKDYKVNGKPDYIKIEVDPDEYRMYHELMGEIKFLFNKMERKYLKQFLSGALVSEPRARALKNDALKSFMKGYMDTNYPYDKNLCPNCHSGVIQFPTGKRPYCLECKTVFGVTKYQGFNENGDAFMSGVATKRSIGQDKLRIGGY
jgi:hypothetical protein